MRVLEHEPFFDIGVNSDSDRDQLKTRMKEENINSRSWFDRGNTIGPTAAQWNVSGGPRFSSSTPTA